MSINAPTVQAQEAGVWYGPLPEDRITRLHQARRLTPPAVQTRQVLQHTPQKPSTQPLRYMPQPVQAQTVQPYRTAKVLQSEQQFADCGSVHYAVAPQVPMMTASQAHVPLGPLVAAKLAEPGHTALMEEGAIGPMVTEQVSLENHMFSLENQQNGEVLALLENLEARMSLMSQMQETRQAIQRRAYAIEALQAPGDDVGGYRMHEEGQWIAVEGEEPVAHDTYVHATVAPVVEPADVQREVLMGHMQVLESMQTPQHNNLKQVATEMAESHAGEDVLGDASSSGDYFQHRAKEVEKKPWPLPSAACAPPFHPIVRGANLALSDGGYLAERAQGCRQAVAIGSEPLQAQAWGWYFEVEVREVVDGWVGGLGIGFTGTPPSSLRRVPDKAWRLPRSAVMGYWGCVFVQGQERGTTWRTDGLAEGSRVGVLATNEGRGDLIVFVNRRPVVRVAGALLGNGHNDISGEVDNGEGSATAEVPLWRLPLFPVVDVFAATRVVAVLREATPPPPPWHIEVDTSRSGSLCSVPLTPVSQQI